MPYPTILDWPDCLNVRDLGGLETVGGGRIAADALIRSDNLTRLTPAGIAIVRASPIGRIIDLRSAAECEHDPSPFAGESLLRQQPLSRPGDPWDPALSLGQNYANNLDRNPELYAAAIELIATAPEGAVVVHCHSGKDRSGSVVALALAVAGVPPGLIAADYAAVSESMKALFATWIEATASPTERAQATEELSSRPETMIMLLDHLKARYSSVEAYLRHGGLGVEVTDRLKSRLLAPRR